MRISMNLGGDAIARPGTPADIVAEAIQAEQDGFPAAWTVHFTRAADALTSIAVAGSRTRRIELGVGIVPSYPRHPLALAQQAATTGVFCGGRLTLGVGVSHKPVIEGLLGIPYASPAAHMREYLQVLVPLLQGEEVSFAGQFYTVNGGFAVAGATPVSVVVGALGPKMVDVAGEFSDGTVTWLAGPRGLEADIVPGLSRAAARAGRPAPRVIAGVPVAVCHDPEQGRTQVAETFARYGGLENYRNLFAREGISSVAEVAVVGTEADVEKQLRRLAEAGATELWPAVFPIGDDIPASMRRTRTLLAELGPEL